MKIPIVIIVRNLLTTTRNLVNDITRMGGFPIIMDNDSTYGPLLKWYSTEPCTIIYLKRNEGPDCVENKIDTILHLSKIIYGYNGRIIGLTDCDCDISHIPDDGILKLLQAGENNHYRKVGFSISREGYHEFFKMYRDTESIYWTTKKNVNGVDCWEALIDTTFTLLYLDRPGNRYGPALRLDEPYSLKHTPFYLDPNNLNEEWLYYYKNIEHPGRLGSSPRTRDHLVAMKLI